LQFFRQLHGGCRAGHDRFKGRTTTHLAHILGKIANSGPLGTGNLTTVGFLLLSYDTEDGGLPRAIGADEPGPRSGEDLEAGIVEEDLTAMLAGDVGQVNHAFESPSIKNHRGRSLWSLLH